MARQEITLPQLGESVTEGTVTAWLKAVGDRVEPDELLFEVSTDKVDTEVPSPTGGYLTEILVGEGDTVDVGTVVCVIADEAPAEGGAPPPGQPAPAEAAEPAAAPTPAAPAPAPAAAPAPAVATPPPAPATPAPAAATPAPAPAAPAPEPTPAAAAPAPASAAAAPAPAPTPEPAAPAATPSPAPRAAASSPAPPQQATPTVPTPAAQPPLLLSPVVRRLINEHGLDPATITATGEGGRITRDDVLAVVESRGNGRQAPPAEAAPAPEAVAEPEQPAASPPPTPAPAPAPAQAPAPAPAPEAQAAPAPGRDEVVPFSNIRRRTAQHMTMSKATSAHAAIVMEVDYENLERVRRASRESFRADEGFGLTYLPFVSRAAIDAIREFPEVNATVDDETLVVHHYIDLGVAVDLDFKGLVVAVSHDADTKRLRHLAREINDLASRARSKKLTPDDIMGATFTITNVGPYGTLITVPIINQPQVAILSTDGVKKRPVVVETPAGDSIAIHAVGNLSLTWDHRAFDGAYCAAFLKRVKEIIETRDWAAELA